MKTPRARPALLLAVVACSNTPEPAPAVCDIAKQTCGGDITGTWELESGCTEGVGLLPLCSGSTLELTRYGGTGTYTFTATGTGVIAGIEHASGKAHFPTGCFDNAPCDQIPPKIRVRGLKATCAPAAAGGCDCEASIDDEVRLAFSYEQAQGPDLTIYLGIETLPASYCVQGDHLSLRWTRFETARFSYELNRKR